MYRTFCRNLCCLFIAVILGGMTAGLVQRHDISADSDTFFPGFPDAASMVCPGLINPDAVRPFIPSSEGSMETNSLSGSQAPCLMSQKCQSQTIGCGQTALAKAGHLQESTMSSRGEPSSRLADYYIFALGRIRV